MELLALCYKTINTEKSIKRFVNLFDSSSLHVRDVSKFPFTRSGFKKIKIDPLEFLQKCRSFPYRSGEAPVRTLILHVYNSKHRAARVFAF
jgi:hypothetical protein